MGVGAGLSMYVVVVQKFTFAISSPDEFLYNSGLKMQNLRFGKYVRPMYLLHDGCRIDDDCDVGVNHGVRKVDDELYCDADDVGTENDCDNCVDDN